MLSRGILIQFNITDDIDYHRPRWSLKLLFFSAHLYNISSSSPYHTAQFIQDYGATALWTEPWWNLDSALYESK
jgi:hypothetical protein